jgi:hypothetical protein
MVSRTWRGLLDVVLADPAGCVGREANALPQKVFSKRATEHLSQRAPRIALGLGSTAIENNASKLALSGLKVATNSVTLQS